MASVLYVYCDVDVCLIGACTIIHFQQTIQKNGTEMTYYEVGCRSNCEYFEENANNDEVTRVTRCCQTTMCTDDLLSDPGNGASGRYSDTLGSVLVMALLGSFITMGI